MMQPEFPESEDFANDYRDVFGNGAVPMANRTEADARFQIDADDRARRKANQALDIKVVQKDRAATLRGYPLATFDEIDADPPVKRWLIKGILARGETSAWIAPPGAMKSALLAEAAICVGAGLDWHGYRNKGVAGVIYFAIERADLVKRRLRAHRQRLGLAGTPICVSSDTIDLTHPEAFKKVIDTIRTAKTIL